MEEEALKIITNPDFFLLVNKNKNRIKSILDAADDFIRKSSGAFVTRNRIVEYKKGTRKKGVFICRYVNEENLKKHFNEIQKDMEMWYTRTSGFLPLIRKEFDVLR